MNKKSILTLATAGILALSMLPAAAEARKTSAKPAHAGVPQPMFATHAPAAQRLAKKSAKGKKKSAHRRHARHVHHSHH